MLLTITGGNRFNALFTTTLRALRLYRLASRD
nr:MAG TPA: hypothetical protein [Caudoviricetes sp.]